MKKKKKTQLKFPFSDWGSAVKAVADGMCKGRKAHRKPDIFGQLLVYCSVRKA